MKILNRYILKEFIKPFFFGVSLFCMLFFISEFFFRLPELIAHHASIKWTFIFLTGHIPMYLRDTLPIAAFFGTIFCLNRLNKDGEIIAMKSSGIDVYRLTLPILLFSLFLSGIGLLLNANIVPDTFLRVRIMREVQLKGKPLIEKEKLTNLALTTLEGQRMTLGFLDMENREAQDVTIDYFSDEYTLQKKIKAKKMVYLEAGKWLLQDCIERKYSPDGKELLKEQKSTRKELYMRDKPEDFVPKKANEELRLSELKSTIETQRAHSRPVHKELVAYHLRFSYPFACLMVTFLGIPFALNLGAKYGRMRNIVYVLFISFSYWILIHFGRVLGEAKILPSILGAWFGNIVFLIIGIFIFLKTPR